MDILAILRKSPVIAALRDVTNVTLHGLPNIGIVFVLGGTIFDLPRIVVEAKRCEKMVFADIDLVKGIGKDASGVHFLAKESKVDGIITTRSNLIRSIQKEGLFAIERMFVLDSESLAGGLAVIEKSNPDAVEILPGLIVPKIIKRIRSITPIPVIAGGLITDEAEIHGILDAGAVGVSATSLPLIKAFGSYADRIHPNQQKPRKD